MSGGGGGRRGRRRRAQAGRQARKSEVIKQLIFSPVVCTHRCEMGGGRCSDIQARSVSSTDTFYGYGCFAKMSQLLNLSVVFNFAFDTRPREKERERRVGY